MAESAATATASRRGTLVVLYGLATGLLLEVVAADLSWIDERLAGLGSAVPEDVRLFDDPTTFVVVTAAVLAATLALGTFLVSRRTGTGFALLSAGTVAWLLFPYAEVPWAAVLGGPASQTFQAPTGAWVLSALIVVLATVELGASARDRLLARLDAHELDAGPTSPIHRRTRFATVAWLGTSVVVGSLGTVLYALTRPLTEGFLQDPDLLWVPALAGLVGGVALWLWARE